MTTPWMTTRSRRPGAASCALLIGLMTAGCALSQESESPGDAELGSLAADDGPGGRPQQAELVLRAGYGGAMGFVLDDQGLAALPGQLQEGEELVVVAGGIDVSLASRRPTVALALTGGEELPLHAVGAAGRRQLGKIQVSLLPDDLAEQEVQFDEGDGFATAASCSHGGTRWVRVGFCGTRCSFPTQQVQARDQMQMCIYGAWYWTQQFRCRFVTCT